MQCIGVTALLEHIDEHLKYECLLHGCLRPFAENLIHCIIAALYSFICIEICTAILTLVYGIFVVAWLVHICNSQSFDINKLLTLNVKQ